MSSTTSLRASSRESADTSAPALTSVGNIVTRLSSVTVCSKWGIAAEETWMQSWISCWNRDLDSPCGGASLFPISEKSLFLKASDPKLSSRKLAMTSRFSTAPCIAVLVE